MWGDLQLFIAYIRAIHRQKALGSCNTQCGSLQDEICIYRKSVNPNVPLHKLIAKVRASQSASPIVLCYSCCCVNLPY